MFSNLLDDLAAEYPRAFTALPDVMRYKRID
jgi:hypothetical protein